MFCCMGSAMGVGFNLVCKKNVIRNACNKIYTHNNSLIGTDKSSEMICKQFLNSGYPIKDIVVQYNKAFRHNNPRKNWTQICKEKVIFKTPDINMYDKTKIKNAANRYFNGRFFQ